MLTTTLTTMLTAHRKFFVAFVFLMVSTSLQAAPCPEPIFHEFDFWIGEWEVSAGGQIAGTNSIQPILEGCVLQEHWRGASGSAGTSLNFYNPQTRQWHQFWVWREGTTLELAGGLRDGKMILEGEGKNRQGNVMKNRITWQKNADGTVRQLWENSSDGQTWNVAFDGLYRRKS